MKVKIISHSSSYTLPTTSLQDFVAFSARVSNPDNQQNTETNEKLIRYLIAHQHWSPFEMVHICIEIQSTRDIIRQILRHRSFSFQEFSQRYAIVPTQVITREARLQDTHNRQNSIEFGEEQEDLKEAWEEAQNKVSEMAQQTYEWALSKGIAKEQARVVLPEGLTKSTLYMNGTLRSWIHYIQLRSGPETQKEHRQIAIACAEAIEPLFPLIRDFVRSIPTDSD